MSVANTIRPPSAFPDAGLVRLSQILAPARPPWRDQTRVAAVAAGPGRRNLSVRPGGRENGGTPGFEVASRRRADCGGSAT